VAAASATMAAIFVMVMMIFRLLSLLVASMQDNPEALIHKWYQKQANKIKKPGRSKNETTRLLK
jgi:hypothetical protein